LTIKSTGRKTRLPSLTPTERQIMTFVLNSVALGTFKDTCSVEGIADALGKSPMRLESMLRKLEEKGYVTLKGDTLAWVYPTPEALQAQDESLSPKEAGDIVAKLGLKPRTRRKS
jgi:hypothetical protein